MKNIFVNQKRWFFFLALILIGLAGSNALLRSTPFGLGLINDSASYIDGANNIMKGLGYVRTSGEGGFKPITNYPPVFSVALIPLRLFGLDIFQSGRFLITLLFGIDIILVGLLIYRISHSFLFSLIGALLLAYSDSFLEVYAYLLSEPLFITFMLLAFNLFSIYFEVRRRRWLVFTGLVLGVACLTRYVGLSIIVNFVLALLLLETNWWYILTGQSAGSADRISFWRRFSSKEASLPIKNIALLLVSSLPLILIWFVYTYIMNSGLGNRSLNWHPIDLSVLIGAMKQNFDWLAPRRLVLILPVINNLLHTASLLLFPGLMLVLLWEIWQRFHAAPAQVSKKFESATAFVLAQHIMLYVLFLVISLNLFDASTPLDSRILSVAIIPLIVLFTCGLAMIWRSATRLKGIRFWAVRIVIGLFCIGIVYSGVRDGNIAVNNLSQDGLGFTQRTLSGSKLFQYIRELPPIKIYSNKPQVILLFSGRASLITPTSVDPVKVQANEDFLNQVETIHKEVQNGQAILVIINMDEKSDPDKYALSLTLTKGLYRQYRDYDIRIFAQSK